MKIRPTRFALAALTMLSVSALAPSQASAWSMQGSYGGSYYISGGYPLGRPMVYYRPSYRPQYGAPSRPEYRPNGVHASPTYAAAPVVTYLPAPTVASAPAAVSYQQSFAPQVTYVTEPAQAPCNGASSAPQTYSPRAYTQAPPQQVYLPQQQTYQDGKPAMYSSTELQK